MQFGKFFKEKREERGLSIRQFCIKYGYDTGNISKMERGVLMPPHSKVKLSHYAKALGIKKDSEDFKTFFALASLDNKAYQLQDIFHVSDKKVIAKLPNFLSTIGGLTEEKLDRILAAVGRI